MAVKAAGAAKHPTPNNVGHNYSCITLYKYTENGTITFPLKDISSIVITSVVS